MLITLLLFKTGILKIKNLTSLSQALSLNKFKHYSLIKIFSPTPKKLLYTLGRSPDLVSSIFSPSHDLLSQWYLRVPSTLQQRGLQRDFTSFPINPVKNLKYTFHLKYKHFSFNIHFILQQKQTKYYVVQHFLQFHFVIISNIHKT